jgi:hypothetical protein
LQIAPDGKIYGAGGPSSFEEQDLRNTMLVIESPNEKGINCQILYKSLTLVRAEYEMVFLILFKILLILLLLKIILTLPVGKIIHLVYIPILHLILFG